jgi:type I restriction enzyme S subunit
MNAQQLRNSILQEAIEGRLVPQDPNDEPASVLLDRIREEKKRLVKEGKLKKKDLIETPITDDEKPFDIPDNWMWCKLGTIAAVLGGKRIPAGRKLTIENTGHIYIRVSDMKENSVSTDNLQYVPEDIFPSISRYIINKEDVYITVAGTIGKIGKIPSELDGANLTENADRLVFSHINQDWLIKCLESNVVQTQITNVTTKVGQPKLAIQKIQALLIPFPPLAEQKRIVTKIEELLPKVEEYGKAQEALDKLNKELPERLKKSILQEAISGRLVPQDPNDEPASVLLDKIRQEKVQLVKEGKLKKKDLIETPITDDEKPFDIPNTWEWVRLSTLTKIIHYGYTASAAPQGNSKLLRITDIQNDKVNWTTVPFCTIKEKELDAYKLNNRDILIARTGGTVGKTYIVRELSCVSVFASYLIRAVPLNSVYEEFVKLFMGSPFYWSQLTDATTGTGQPNVNGQSLSRLIIPLPPLAEQKRIVAKIEELFAEIDKLKA